MILTGQLLLPHPSLGSTIAPGQVRIQRGRIAQVALGEGHPIGTPDIGSVQTLISPGFIDTHLHLPQFDCIGIDGLTLLDWLERAVFPTEAKWADADHAGSVTTRVGKRLLAAGTTGIAAYATVHHEGAKQAIDALHSWGGRAIVGQVLMDQQAPAELIRPAKQLLAEAAALQSQGVGRVEVAVTPRFAVSCSQELLTGCGDLAGRTQAAVQTHLSETIPECELVKRLHGCETYTEVYRRAGLLGARTILGHGIWLSESECAAIARAGSVVAHCPTANLFLQAGSMDRGGHLDASMKIGLGSDVAGGPDVCMVRVARAMIETAKSRRLNDGCTRVPTPGEAWGQITRRNAEVLGWSDSGSLTVGAWADLVVIDPTRGPAQPEWLRAVDPLSLLLYAFDERWISHTVVQGRVAYVG